jgi:hypothetical protein
LPPLREDGGMGDKSLKSKQRDQKQKEAAKEEGAAVAKAKQDANVQMKPPSPKAAR